MWREQILRAGPVALTSACLHVAGCDRAQQSSGLYSQLWPTGPCDLRVSLTSWRKKLRKQVPPSLYKHRVQPGSEAHPL